MANYFSSSQINDLKYLLNSWPNDIPLAIEFRHKSWFEKESIKSMARIFSL